MAAGHGHARHPQEGRALLRPVCAHAYAIRETLDLLLRTFPIRTCSDNKLERHRKQGRPCLLFHIEQCSGPCINEITPERYAELVSELIEFLQGNTDFVVERLEAQMRVAADDYEYELAARIRDRLASVRRAIEKQQMVADSSEDLDVVGIAEDELEAAVQVFFVRHGRMLGRKGFILDKVMALTDGELAERILEELYYDPPPMGMPKAVLMPSLPDDPGLYEDWLTEHRGSRVQIRIPQRGAKRQLAETVTQNATEEFRRHRLRRARPQQPGPGTQRAAGPARTAGCSAAHRVLRHEPHPGHRLRRVDGRTHRRDPGQA